MEKVAIDDVEPAGFGDGVDRRGLSDPLETAHVAINRYVIEPGERVSGLHAHADQEEVFLVVAGEATFETLDGEVPVGAGEAVRFAPGEFQSATNDSTDAVVTYALGAPRGTEDVRIPLACPECGHDDLRLAFGEDGEALVCPDCGAETSAACPACGREDMRAVLGDEGEPVGVCQSCGAESTP